MNTPGDAEATGMSDAQAAEAIDRLLAGKGDNGGEEPLKEEDDEESEPSETEDDDGEEPEASEDGSEADEDAEADDAQPATLTVKIDGEELQVTLEEAAAGYSRTQDYTRKTMALAEERKAFDAEKQSLEQEREKYTQVLQTWEQQLSTPLYDPEETEALRYTDPAEWAARKAEEQERVGRLQALQGERTRLTAQQAKEAADRHARAIAEAEHKLFDAVPEWKADPEVAKKGLAQIWDYAAAFGFTPQDILADPDHRALLILKDAASYRALKSRSVETRAKVETVKAAKPGAKANQPPKVTEVTRAKQRLAKTGRVEDAAAAIERMLSR